MTIGKLSRYTLLILVCVIMTFCTTNKEVNNPLLEEWTGPYGGLPAFDQIDIADVQDAMLTGMELSLAEIEAIANNPDDPNFKKYD